MTAVKTLPCPHGVVGAWKGFNGKFRREHGVASVVAFPRIRGAMWMRRFRVEPRIRTNWTKVMSRSDVSEVDAWLGRLLKRDKSYAEGESQKTAVVDVHFRFSFSNPRSLSHSLSKWFGFLKGTQSLLLLQNGGGGNRDGDFSMRLGYGGDDDSDDSKGKPWRSKKLSYARWAAGVALMSLLVWALRRYSGVPRRTQFRVSQLVDCVVWLGLAWCVAAVVLWAARMVVALTPAGLDNRNLFRSRNAFLKGRELILRSKFDEWMTHNVVAVPGLAISLFLVCDLIHYATSIDFVARINSHMSRVPDFLNSRVTAKGDSLFSRGSAVKKGRRGILSKRQRP